MEFGNEKFERKKLFGIEFVGLRTYNVEKKEIYSEKQIGMKQKSLKKTKIKRKKRLEQSDYHNIKSLKRLISNRKEWNFRETRMKRNGLLLTDLNI